MVNGIASGDVKTGRGLNQERNLKRACDTGWGSHYGTIVSVINLFNPILDVLEVIRKDGPTIEKRSEAYGHLKNMQTFEFVLFLELMSKMLGITNDLSQVLQRKDQHLINAMTLVETSKARLQEVRENGWDILFEKTCEFCTKHDVDVLDM